MVKAIVITEILDDVRAADEITCHFERRWWVSSADICEVFCHGLLDNGEHREAFALGVGFWEMKRHRENDL